MGKIWKIGKNSQDKAKLGDKDKIVLIGKIGQIRPNGQNLRKAAGLQGCRATGLQGSKAGKLKVYKAM